jgi:hypothetical protein
MIVVARASTLGGMVKPICFAVLRLITSSNFLGCSTGKIGRLGSLQDSVHVIGNAPVAVRDVRSVPHEPAVIHSFSVVIHRRYPLFNAKPAIRFPLANIKRPPGGT